MRDSEKLRYRAARLFAGPLTDRPSSRNGFSSTRPTRNGGSAIGGQRDGPALWRRRKLTFMLWARKCEEPNLNFGFVKLAVPAWIP